MAAGTRSSPSRRAHPPLPRADRPSGLLDTPCRGAACTQAATAARPLKPPFDRQPPSPPRERRPGLRRALCANYRPPRFQLSRWWSVVPRSASAAR